MNRKRLFALVLSVLMVLTLVPALGEEAAADAEEYVYVPAGDGE